MRSAPRVFRSGWCSNASRRYAARISAWDAVGAPNPYHLDPELLRRATLFNAARTRAVVERLPEGSSFYFARQVGDVSCDWSLGMFLEDAAAAAADRAS